MQLIKLWRTKSAKDLSYTYLWLYAVGLLFITVYLYLEKATVGWICDSIETGELVGWCSSRRSRRR
jgi:uncharacterized protein with PQ loop repeat